MPRVPANEALIRLKSGNERFTSGIGGIDTFQSRLKMRELARTGQYPFAVVLSCSDSRAPSELLFDQGLGDLFVIRVAGNYIAPSIIGSVEFAAAAFGTELVVVMGHTKCGAIQVTLDAMLNDQDALSENVQDIISRIRPGLERLRQSGVSEGELRSEAVRANVRASVEQLRHGSRIIESLVAQNKMLVVGAECSLETGIVHFLDEENIR